MGKALNTCMSYAKKANGFRRITVEGAGYRWCFRPGRDDSTVTLQGSESGGQQAIVTLRGVRDPWLAISDGDAQFVSVTPRVVRRMIQQRCLAAGSQHDKQHHSDLISSHMTPPNHGAFQRRGHSS